jgi:hypothetical protein
MGMMTDNTNCHMSYEIIVKGQLDVHWQAWFGDLNISPTEDGNTILSGMIADQAALYGILKRINNLGLRLVSVNSQTKR